MYIYTYIYISITYPGRVVRRHPGGLALGVAEALLGVAGALEVCAIRLVRVVPSRHKYIYIFINIYTNMSTGAADRMLRRIR